MIEIDGWNEKPVDWEEEPEYLKKIMDQQQSIYSKIKFNKYDNVDLDAIFVLAGGLKNNGNVHEWVIRRLDLAYNIYKTKKDNSLKIICLGGGTYHKPPILNKDSYIVHESTACAEYLIQLGVNPKNVYKEWASYDTIANSYFANVNFIYPMKLKHILLITSEFHMKRTIAIFNWIKSLNKNNYQMYFEAVPDQGLDNNIINAREIREKSSLNNLKTYVFPKIKTLQDFHKWFYEDHKAYCSNSENIRNTVLNINNKIKETY